MAIHFEWYENPVAPNQSKKDNIHPRIALNGSIGTDELRYKIQERSSLTETDVSAVLDALSHIMGEELADGRQVHLDGIGYFRPSLTCTEEVKTDTPRKNTKVKLKGIKYRADQALKNAVGSVKLKNIKLDEHSDKLTNEEIDVRLKAYFSNHPIMTRTDFQQMCGMLKSTAMAHIRRLRAEGKINNIGLRTQPMYVPAAELDKINKENVAEQK